jgi:hypothetical protein
MGHYLDPLLDEVKKKYSADVHDAYDSGFNEGAEYVENLLMDLADANPHAADYLKELVAWTKTRPSR